MRCYTAIRGQEITAYPVDRSRKQGLRRPRALLKAIGDRRIVMPSEIPPVDGAVFWAKIRLIRYPATPIGINLPNPNWIRDQHGSGRLLPGVTGESLRSCHFRPERGSRSASA